MHRTLIHDHTYTAALAALSQNLRRLDDALVGVEWALATNPEVYDVMRGTAYTRILKTDALGGLPPLRIWFRIDEQGQHVHLLYIEIIDDES